MIITQPTDPELKARMEKAAEFYRQKYEKEKQRLLGMPNRDFQELVNDLNAGGVEKVPRGSRARQVEYILRIEFPSR